MREREREGERERERERERDMLIDTSVRASYGSFSEDLPVSSSLIMDLMGTGFQLAVWLMVTSSNCMLVMLVMLVRMPQMYWSISRPSSRADFLEQEQDMVNTGHNSQ